MIDNINKTLTIAFVFTFILSIFSFAQEKQDSSMMSQNMKMHKMEMMKYHKMNMECDSTHQEMHDKMNCTDTTNCAKMKGSMNHTMVDMKNMNHSMMMDSTQNKMSDKKDPIVRKGVIDLQTIDKNKDGKVFQDMMDYNVISDKPGKCPLCGMKLKEVSLKKAKDTLIKAGFEVK